MENLEETQEETGSPSNTNLEEENDSGNVDQKTAFRDLLSSSSLIDILEKQGFTQATPVQSATIPVAMKGRDLIVQAQTGSGKTLAFGIPLLAKLEEVGGKLDPSKTFALIVSPTRELANQIAEVMDCVSTDAKPVLVIGGESINKQRKALEKDARIVIGTPGRILDMLHQRALNLKQCRYFVLDEADEMCSMGFFEDVRAILSRLPRERQGLFVSATISPRVGILSGSFLDKAENIVVDEIGKDLPPIEHLYCNVSGEVTAKPDTLADFIETLRPRSAIVFCNTKSDTELVEVYLRRRGFDARKINSDLTQRQRARIMDKIRSQDLRFLIATDIAARGLDIEQIELVVNYSFHDEPDLYFHRTGRTGRAGKSGRALSLVGPQDSIAFHKLKKVMDADFTEIIPPTDVDVADARLAHLYELLRLDQRSPSDRDLLVVKKLFKEIGALEDIPEELQEMMVKLGLSFMEHSVGSETAGWDQELDGRSEEKRGSRGGGRGRGRDGSGSRKGSSYGKNKGRSSHRNKRGRQQGRGRR